MKKLPDNSTTLIIVIFLAMMTLLIVSIAGRLDPSSFFCLYKIYQQPSGVYEVWWMGRTKSLSGTFHAYEEAKAFQIKECQTLKDYMKQKPEGKRVR